MGGWLGKALSFGWGGNCEGMENCGQKKMVQSEKVKNINMKMTDSEIYWT